VDSQHHSQAGFSLVETVVSIGVLVTGVLGLAGVLAAGLQKMNSSPDEVLAIQKASEAIESVFSARDSRVVGWAQLRNVSDGGIFLNGPQSLKVDGEDGILNTADDGAAEQIVLPGPDQVLNTADDVTRGLAGFKREISIAALSADLRSVTVTITYVVGASTRSYVLTAYISTVA
jgi:type II secretory pathway pseudopilin PulG